MDFDDSIIEDKQAERQSDRQDVSMVLCRWQSIERMVRRNRGRSREKASGGKWGNGVIT